MPIIIHSPYSGRAVKIRDQDIERAVRDDEGRIFYVVPRSDGDGYYAAPTRKGSEKDERRYVEMLEKMATNQQVFQEQSQQQIHDATGRPRRGGLLRLLIILTTAAAAGILAYWYITQHLNP